MDHFTKLLRRFARDESGVFAVIFGVMAIVLIALGGAVVDYVTLEQTKSRAQTALDAAALALQPRILEPGFNAAGAEILRGLAEDIMIERIGDSRVTASIPADGVVTNVEDGSLYFRASFSMPTTFVALVGVPRLGAQVQSEATRRKLSMEIVFVLDNSGSMKETGAGTNGTRQRMQFLKDAANCATFIMFYKNVVNAPGNSDTCIQAPGAPLLDDVKLGVVPFTMFVNVGASNRNASWIDKGNSVIANDNFDDGRSPPGNIDRANLFAATKTAWAGCVEARPHIKTGSKSTEYLDTDDTPAVFGNTLFVPMFAPDIEDNSVDYANQRQTNNYLSDTPAICDRPARDNTTCVYTQQRTCTTNRGNTTCTSASTTRTEPRGPVNFAASTLFSGGYYGAHASSCSCRNGVDYGNWSTGNNQTRTGTCVGGGYVPEGLSTRQLQERVCKYYGPVLSTGTTRGPNADCGKAPILPLTATPKLVTDAITAMVAEGGTNIHEGAAWGFRALSPGLPFDQGQAYSQDTAKVMILMTDGENTTYNLSNPNYCNITQMRAFNGSCFNSAYGYPYNSRNSDNASSSSGNVERLGYMNAPNATLVSEMNTRTVQTCENARNAGITIYTIGLATSQASQSTQAQVEDMLTKCAGSSARAYFPQNPADLKSVFQLIANDLTVLRLAQ